MTSNMKNYTQEILEGYARRFGVDPLEVEWTPAEKRSVVVGAVVFIVVGVIYLVGRHYILGW